MEGIRRRKITLLFLVLDADENGYIERSDFERVADDLYKMKQTSRAEDENFDEIKKSFTRVFESMHDLIDKNDDAKVELDEWVTYFDTVLADEQQYADLIEPMARNIFVLLDHNGDGKISISEFRHFTQVYRIGDSADKLFHKLDQNGNGVITRDEFGHMITDFFLSEDPDVPGNYIFGNY